MASLRWTPQDLSRMKKLGIHPSAAASQLRLLQSPPAPIHLLRPARPGDGVLRLGPREVRRALADFRRASQRGRFTKFVPASGAASRMFQTLLKWKEGDRSAEAASAARTFLKELPRFAFYPDLKKELSRRGAALERLRSRGDLGPILEALVGKGGLGYAEFPKGLLPFHRDKRGGRTAVEEHLLEGARTLGAGSGRCRIHFTVSQEHQGPFREHLKGAVRRVRGISGVRCLVGLSTQGAHTQTLAGDERGRPFRDRAGKLVFRPSGHGALLGNLQGTGGDLVFIKNIDNVASGPRAEKTLLWKKVLGGFLAGVQEELSKALDLLARAPRPGKELKAVREWAEALFGLDLGRDFNRLSPGLQRKRLRLALDRPLRVCGVVPNRGEPGGGPFWVGKGGRRSLQIVEKAQVDWKDRAQRGIFLASTHFNPVDLVCSLRDHRGRAFDLSRFTDPGAVLISPKSLGGRDLRALELPGLWNGSMAGWLTIFVEVPEGTFNPVKTVLDLAKPAHRSRV